MKFNAQKNFIEFIQQDNSSNDDFKIRFQRDCSKMTITVGCPGKTFISTMDKRKIGSIRDALTEILNDLQDEKRLRNWNIRDVFTRANDQASIYKKKGGIPVLGAPVIYIRENGPKDVPEYAAVISFIHDLDIDLKVTLQVFNVFSDGTTCYRKVPYSESPKPNSWHWPEE